MNLLKKRNYAITVIKNQKKYNKNINKRIVFNRIFRHDRRIFNNNERVYNEL